MTLHLNYGGEKFWVHHAHDCPGCADECEAVGFDQAWYGITWTCTGCGCVYSDGWFIRRRNQTGWQRRAEEAQARLRFARKMGSAAHRAWMRYQIEGVA